MIIICLLVEDCYSNGRWPQFILTVLLPYTRHYPRLVGNQNIASAFKEISKKCVLCGKMHVYLRYYRWLQGRELLVLTLSSELVAVFSLICYQGVWRH